MANARGRFEWSQTSSLIAVVVNMMRDPKKNKPATPEMFNPFLTKTKKDIPKVSISVLRDVFVKGEKQNASSNPVENSRR